MKVTFCGAAGTVTGSCHLVETDGRRILLDCGMFQGRRPIEQRNRQPFPFDPREIDTVFLSHAHLDHIGLVPRLVREGFAGEILATPATAEIARLMLADAAHIQVEEAAYRARKARRRGERVEAPLYDMGDVLNSLTAFRRAVPYEKTIDLSDRLSAVFHDAGHILGSAFIELRDGSTTLVYSGDLGNRHQPIVHDPSDPPHADLLLIESTYGDRAHRTLEDSVDELREAVRSVIGGGGNLLVPSFALERTQEVLYVLFCLWRDGELPECRIYLDSPLAIATTRVFGRHLDVFDADGQEVFSRSPNPFSFPPLRFSQTTEESKAINALPGGNIIIAGSGMCTGGRIIHHLRHNLWREDSGIVFVGYQVTGTLGRQIVDGADTVSVFGEDVAVRARVWTVNGFSSHADRPILLDWIRHSTPDRVYLVHGEERVLDALARAVDAEIPTLVSVARWKESVALDDRLADPR